MGEFKVHLVECYRTEFTYLVTDRDLTHLPNSLVHDGYRYVSYIIHLTDILVFQAQTWLGWQST